MNALQKRADQIALGRQRQAVERIAVELKRVFHDLQIEADQTAARMSGRGLVKRWLRDSRLRFVADVSK